MEEKTFLFVKFAVAIIWEAFPFVVLGAIIAGILEEVVPQQAIAKILPKNRLLSVAVGALLGLVFPMCECGIVPVMRRLLRKGMPLPTCVAYMLAGPIINGIVILSTWKAFVQHGIGPQMVGLRVGLGFIVAVITALFVHRQYRKYGNKLLTPLAAPQTDHGLLEVLEGDPIHPSIGRAGREATTVPANRQHLRNVAARFRRHHGLPDPRCMYRERHQGLGADGQEVATFSEGYPALSILAMMVMAVAMCLCSEADAFVAASFTTLAPSAKVAFLVLGPMFDLKLLLMFTRVFRRRLIVTIVLSVSIQVFVYSMAVHYLWPHVFQSGPATTISGQ